MDISTKTYTNHFSIRELQVLKHMSYWLPPFYFQLVVYKREVPALFHCTSFVNCGITRISCNMKFREEMVHLFKILC